MGQVHCDHKNSTEKSIIHEDKGLLFSYSIIEYECNDCLTDGKPTLFRKEITNGNITGMTYSSQKCEPRNCKHKLFQVDDSTIKTCSESSLSGALTGLLTAGWLHFDHKFLQAEAICLKCKRKFLVQSNYHINEEWEDYKIVKTRVIEEWRICYNKIKLNREDQTYEIAYI